MTEAQLKGSSILIVDDDVSNTCFMSNFLNRLGYTNLRSLNQPSEIFNEMAVLSPDLIVLDLVMPGVDGFVLLGQLRKDEVSENQIPILVISGFATPENKRKAFRLGATDFLTKPIDTSELSIRIRNLLQSRFLQLESQEHNRLLEERVSERTGELKHALDELQNAQSVMLQQERLHAFGEMAGGVVHDFSNALMAVIGYSDMLLSDDDSRTDAAILLDYLKIINTAGKDAAHVVSRLRDFYRPRTAEDPFEALDLNAVATEAIALSRLRCKERESERKIQFKTDLATNVTTCGIASDVRAVLTNLIFNAIDATPGSGSVTVRTRTENGESVVEVEDTGEGMSAEVKRRCLEPFFTTKGNAGTGLGLAMVFGIVKRHQGRIAIDSKPKQGTTFRIFFPANSQPAPNECSTELVTLAIDAVRVELGAAA